MLNLFKKIIAASLLTTSFSAYAINIHVTATSKDIQGLGFTTQGKEYGGLGSSYKKSGLHRGNYNFGLRKNGKDIGCKNVKGKNKIYLSKNTNVILSLKDKSCIFKIK